MSSKLHLILSIIAIVLTVVSLISLVYGLIHNILVFEDTHVLPDFPVFSYWIFVVSITISFITIFIPNPK